MKIPYSRWALIASVLLAIVQLTACNTIEGVGKDVKRAGESIEKAGNNGKK